MSHTYRLKLKIWSVTKKTHWIVNKLTVESAIIFIKGVWGDSSLSGRLVWRGDMEFFFGHKFKRVLSIRNKRWFKKYYKVGWNCQCFTPFLHWFATRSRILANSSSLSSLAANFFWCLVWKWLFTLSKIQVAVGL